MNKKIKDNIKLCVLHITINKHIHITNQEQRETNKQIKGHGSDAKKQTNEH